MAECINGGAPEHASEKVLLMESFFRGPCIYVGLENAHGPVTTNGPHKREDLVLFNRVDLINTVWKHGSNPFVKKGDDGVGVHSNRYAQRCYLLDLDGGCI